VHIVFLDLNLGEGGPRNALAELGRALQARGERVSAILVRERGLPRRVEVSFGDSVSFLEQEHVWSGPPYVRSGLRQIVPLIREAVKGLSPTLLVANTTGQLSLAVAARPGGRIAVALRNSALSRGERAQLSIAPVLARMKAFAPSSYAASLAPGILRKRAVVIPDPVPIPSDSLAPFRSNIATVGVVTGSSRVKGADFVLEMAERSRPLPVIWRVFGLCQPGSWGAAYFQALRDLPNVDLVGHVSFTDQLADLDATVVVSRRESFCLVAAETMAAGRAVVAPRHTGLPATLDDGRAGRLYEPGDVAGAIAHLRSLLDDPEEGRRLGQLGRAFARQRFSPDIVAARFADFARSE
jgi:glycosyltransferase involved in cell wall biosynthesis